jgi:hypothetical protein
MSMSSQSLVRGDERAEPLDELALGVREEVVLELLLGLPLLSVEDRYDN